MNDNPETHGVQSSPPLDDEQRGRRDFLLGLGRWSKVVIGAAVLGGFAVPGADVQAGSWVNRRGVGGWINGR